MSKTPPPAADRHGWPLRGRCVAAGGVILVGGRSSRMGRPKDELPWGETTLAGHVVDVVAAAVDGPVVVVHAPGRAPTLRPGIETAADAQSDRGPLEGLAAGLRALAGRADAAYVSATDAPFLSEAFVRLVVASLGDEHRAAVPVAGDRMYPLSAAYRLDVLPVVERLLAEHRRRATDLLDEVAVRWLDETTLRTADPELRSLVNVNTPEDYERALALRSTRSRWV